MAWQQYQSNIRRARQLLIAPDALKPDHVERGKPSHVRFQSRITHILGILPVKLALQHVKLLQGRRAAGLLSKLDTGQPCCTGTHSCPHIWCCRPGTGRDHGVSHLAEQHHCKKKPWPCYFR